MAAELQLSSRKRLPVLNSIGQHLMHHSASGTDAIVEAESLTPSSMKRARKLTCTCQLFMILWILVGGLCKIFERILFTAVYRYLYTLFLVQWARVAAGFGLGLLLSSFFWMLDVVIDPSKACAIYVVIFAYVTGCVFIGWLALSDFVTLPRFKLWYPDSESWKVSPQGLDPGAYAGLFAGLSVCFYQMVVISAHYPSGIYPPDWCAPHGSFPVAWWGCTFLLLGIFASTCVLPEFEEYKRTICVSMDERHKGNHSNGTGVWTIDGDAKEDFDHDIEVA